MSKDMESKVFKVRPNSTSIKGTIPQGVVQALQLEHGSTLKWLIKARDGKIYVELEKG